MAALATLPAFATLSAFAFAVISATRSTLVDVGHEVMIQHPSRKRHFLAVTCPQENAATQHG